MAGWLLLDQHASPAALAAIIIVIAASTGSALGDKGLRHARDQRTRLGSAQQQRLVLASEQAAPRPAPPALRQQSQSSLAGTARD
jgi:hypothetical protein